MLSCCKLVLVNLKNLDISIKSMNAVNTVLNKTSRTFYFHINLYLLRVFYPVSSNYPVQSAFALFTF